jgi:hypothetical protein
MLVRIALARGTMTVGTIAQLTDGFGRVRFDTLDFGGVGPGTYTARLAFDGTDTYQDTVRDVPLTVGPENVTVSLSVPRAPVAVDPTSRRANVTITGTITQEADGALGDLHAHAPVTLTFAPDGGTPISQIVRPEADGSFSVSIGLPAGVYGITATVGDWFIGQATGFLAVYDSDIFATGGGWILTTATTRPAGTTPLPAGKKANFAFNLKYKSGTTIPIGNVLFDLKEAALEFRATSVDWLVIGDDRTEFQGRGTINGAGAYAFRVIATHVSTGDTFEIRIWDPAIGSFDAPRYVAANALGGGNIVAHN